MKCQTRKPRAQKIYWDFPSQSIVLNLFAQPIEINSEAAAILAGGASHQFGKEIGLPLRLPGPTVMTSR